MQLLYFCFPGFTMRKGNNPLKHGRKIWERGHKASKKYLLPFHSVLNTFALTAPHLQRSGSLCARSSSSQRSRLWPSCPSLLQTWAWHCLLRTWWCLQSSSGIQGYVSWGIRGWMLSGERKQWGLGGDVMGRELSRGFFFLFFLWWLLVCAPPDAWAWSSEAGYSACWLEIVQKGNVLLFLNFTELLTVCSDKTWKGPSSVLTLYLWKILSVCWELSAPDYF